MDKSPRDQSIGAQMAIALQLMKNKQQQTISKLGYKITIEQFSILETLHFSGEMNMTQLAQAVWKQNANITRMVDKLEKQQLLIRKPSKNDRRTNHIIITEKGKWLFKKVVPTIVETYEDMTSSITKEEEAITLKTLKKIIIHLSEN